MELLWDGGMKVCSNGPGHMTKMATMPIYGKNLKNNLLRNRKADDLESWSNLVPYAFVWEKVKTMDFSETMIWN